MWYWGGGGIHWWGWLIGFVLTIGFWALIIFLIVSLFHSFAPRDHDHRRVDRDDPERPLVRRSANGEIDEDEFHRRLDVLRLHGLGRNQ